MTTPTDVSEGCSPEYIGEARIAELVAQMLEGMRRNPRGSYSGRCRVALGSGPFRLCVYNLHPDSHGGEVATGETVLAVETEYAPCAEDEAPGELTAALAAVDAINAATPRFQADPWERDGKPLWTVVLREPDRSRWRLSDDDVRIIRAAIETNTRISNEWNGSGSPTGSFCVRFREPLASATIEAIHGH